MVDWKKDVKLSRRKSDPADDDAEPFAEKTPFWKKEVSLGRKKRSEEDSAPEAAKPAKAPKSKRERKRAGPEPSTPVAPAPPLAAAPEPAALAPEPPAPVFEWLSAAFEDAPRPEPLPLPVEAAPRPEPQPEVPLAAVPVPVSVPPPAPGIHPPVRADELPPLSEAPEGKKKRSFLGRDGSDGRKPKAEKPPKEPKQRKERKRTDPSEKTSREETPAGQTSKPSKAARAKSDRSHHSKLPKKLVGLKIGASQLAAARVVNNGVVEILQVAREELAPGIVVGGELRDPEALAEALKDFFRKHKLPRRGVRLGIANNRIGVRTFEIAGIHDPKQLAGAIRFRAQEALPIPIEEAVLDYQVLEETTNDEGEPVRRILLVVAYRELIDRYVSACRKAGITLAGIDLEAFALLRSLAAPAETDAEPPEAALVAVAVGHERSTFAVSDGRVCEFTRVLEWGGSALNIALARAFDITPAEAEPVKRAISLRDESVPEGLTAEHAAAARDAIRKQVQSFARELVSSLQFYQNQPGSLGIGEIIVTGGTAHLPGLTEELEGMLGVPVRVGDPLARVRVSKRLHEPDQVGSLAVAIGLGIED